MQDIKSFWDGIAPKYAKSPIKNQAGYELTLERTQSYLKETDSVLEIGAGTGRTALILAKSVAEYLATDISTSMLEVGKAEAWEQCVGNIRFEARHCDDMPKGPFDAVIAMNLLHLVDDLPKTLKAAHAALNPGGLLISKTFCKPQRGLQLEYRMIRIVLPLMQKLGKAPFVAMMHPDALDQAFLDAGFELVETGHYPANEARRYIVARKI